MKDNRKKIKDYILNKIFLFFVLFFSISYLLNPLSAIAQSSSINVSTLLPKSILFLSPRTATMIEGSTIEVSVFINTQNTSVNTVQLRVKFDPTRLAMIKPSNTNSIISLFIDPPMFSNLKGTMKLSGVILNGIKTDSGLLATMTFKAIATGQTVISVADDTKVLANDGQGTEVKLDLGRGTYTILPKSPEGPRVYSDTHPFQEIWYNNNSPQVVWDKDPGVTDFSYTVDNKPFTIPDNDSDSTITETSFRNLSDGIYYFHIKAEKQGIWGPTTHFMIRIDSTPPAGFRPEIQFLVSSSSKTALVSFFTTDALSGLDHYEVGVVKKDGETEESPLFSQVGSPYRFPVESSDGATFIVRAFDRAGNSIDESADMEVPSDLAAFLRQNILAIILLLALILDLLFGHKTFYHLKNIVRAVKEEEKRDVYEHEKKAAAQEYLDKFVK